MTLIILFFVAGIALGWLLRQHQGIVRVTDRLTIWSVYVLLGVLGLSVGTSRQVLENIGGLGLQAAILTLGAILGSVLAVQLLPLLPPPVYGGTEGGTGGERHHLKTSLIILAWFAAGILVGALAPLPDGFAPSDYTVYVLYALLLFVGVGLGGDHHSWPAIRRTSLRIVLVPLLVVVGTLAGAALASLLLPSLGLRDSLAVGAGFGYYSLSSVLLTQARGETLGVVALLSNLMREIGTLLLAPLLVRLFGRLAPIACAGATAMDSTLPAIARFSGKEYSIVAMFSGIVLTVAVPFLIFLILSL
jgi:uncharacterized membrane protein YbjE (DUF340 family)